MNSGNKFEGIWKNDKKYYGIEKMRDGNYTGYFQNDLPHGQGQITKQDIIFEGVFEKGEKPKIGKIIYKDGSKYFGKILENFARNGYGFYIDKNKHKYEVQWQYDKMIGIGRITYSNGDIYLGSLDTKGAKNGLGVLISPTETYQGYFKNELRDGIGFTFYSDGRVYQGQYKSNIPDGQGEFFTSLDLKFEKNLDIDHFTWEVTRDGVYKICQNIKPILTEEEK